MLRFSALWCLTSYLELFFRCCRWCCAPLCDFSVLSSILSWIGLSWGASLQRQRERKMEQFYTSKNKASDRLVCLRQQLSWFNDHTKNTLTHIAELPRSATPFARNLSFCARVTWMLDFCGIKERCLWLDWELTQSHTPGHLTPWECKLKLKKCLHWFASPLCQDHSSASKAQRNVRSGVILIWTSISAELV